VFLTLDYDDAEINVHVYRFPMSRHIGGRRLLLILERYCSNTFINFRFSIHCEFRSAKPGLVLVPNEAGFDWTVARNLYSETSSLMTHKPVLSPIDDCL